MKYSRNRLYICQLKNGNMLFENKQRDGYLEVAKTGYPYPDTPKSNTEMLQDLFWYHLGVDLPTEFFAEKYKDIIDYTSNGVFNQPIKRHDTPRMTVKSLAQKVLGERFIPNLLKGKALYLIYECRNHKIILIEDSDTIVKDSGCLFIVPSSYVEKGYKIDESNYKMDFIYTFLRRSITSRLGQRFNNEELNMLFMLAVDSLFMSNSVYEVFELNNLDRFYDLIFNNDKVLNNFMAPTLTDMLSDFLLGSHNIQMKASDLASIISISDISLGNDIVVREDKRVICSLVKYCIDVDLGIERDKFLNNIVLKKLLVSVIIKYALFLEDLIVEEDEKCYLDVSETLQRGYIDELYEKDVDFRRGVDISIQSVWAHNIGNKDNHIKPTSISDNRVEWDLDSVFDTQLWQIRDMLYDKLYNDEIVRSPLSNIIKEDKVFELMQSMYADIKDVNYVVFKAVEFEERKRLILSELDAERIAANGVGHEKIRYFETIPEDVEELLGEFSLFARVFCCDGHSESFKSFPKHYYDESTNSVTYSYIIAKNGETFFLSEEMFDTGFKGACIIDFIGFMLHNYSMQHSKISLDNIKIVFDEKSQTVKIRYRF